MSYVLTDKVMMIIQDIFHPETNSNPLNLSLDNCLSILNIARLAGFDVRLKLDAINQAYVSKGGTLISLMTREEIRNDLDFQGDDHLDVFDFNFEFLLERLKAEKLMPQRLTP